MSLHRNAKLGLAGRRELVLAVASGASLREAARTFQRLRRDRSSLVEALDERQRL